MFLSLITHPTVGNIVDPEVVDRHQGGKADGPPLDLLRPVGHERNKVDVGPSRGGGTGRKGSDGVGLCVVVG